MKIKHIIAGLATATCFAVPAFATPIVFNIGSITVTPGTGYGATGDDQLDVTFGATSAPAAFGLEVNGSQTFDITKVKLKEECINPGNCGQGDESDNLNVSIQFNFISPFSGNQIVTVNGFARTGPVTDNSANAPADYTLNFDATDITFGNGGKFNLDITDLAFFNLNQEQTLKATITLLAAPQAANPGQVPEPATLALMGLGLAGLSVRAKRRKA